MHILWFVLAMAAITAPWFLWRALGWTAVAVVVLAVWLVWPRSQAPDCDYACKVGRADHGRVAFGDPPH